MPKGIDAIGVSHSAIDNPKPPMALYTATAQALKPLNLMRFRLVRPTSESSQAPRKAPRRRRVQGSGFQVSGLVADNGLRAKPSGISTSALTSGLGECRASWTPGHEVSPKPSQVQAETAHKFLWGPGGFTTRRWTSTSTGRQRGFRV